MEPTHTFNLGQMGMRIAKAHDVYLDSLAVAEPDFMSGVWKGRAKFSEFLDNRKWKNHLVYPYSGMSESADLHITYFGSAAVPYEAWADLPEVSKLPLISEALEIADTNRILWIENLGDADTGRLIVTDRKIPEARETMEGKRATGYDYALCVSSENVSSAEMLFHTNSNYKGLEIFVNTLLGGELK